MSPKNIQNGKCISLYNHRIYSLVCRYKAHEAGHGISRDRPHILVQWGLHQYGGFIFTSGSAAASSDRTDEILLCTGCERVTAHAYLPLHLKTYFLKSLHFGNFKNSVLKWVTRMYCFGLQKWNKTGYKNGMDRVTRFGFQMTGIRTDRTLFRNMGYELSHPS